MCNPAMAIGAVMMAGSLAANNQAQKKVDKARAGAQEAESIRQRMFDEENTTLNTQSQDRYQDYETKQGDKAQDIASFYSANESPSDAPSAIPISDSGNITVQREMAKKSGEALTYGDQQNAALASLRSFGDLLGGIGREQARDASQINLVNSFKQGSANILPLELQAANAKGNNLRLLGSLLQAGGSAGVSAGMGGLVGPDTATTGVAPIAQQQATGLTIQQNANAGLSGLPKLGLR